MTKSADAVTINKLCLYYLCALFSILQSWASKTATQSQMRIIIIYILKVTTMNISKKKAKQIADLINSLEVTYMIGEDEYGKDRFIEKINETTQELFDLGIPMVILRDEEKA